tara:strand:+ start:995 stop:1348 length:354 start_codon:yes stop_codon:yes gene_type:complete
MNMNKQYININNTREWIKCNEDTFAPRWRQIFVEQNGGEFVHNGRFWQWQENATIKEEKSEVANEKQLYIITKPDGGQVTIDNLSKFCREHKLNKSTMYLVMNGKRNHHKHYKCAKV